MNKLLNDAVEQGINTVTLCIGTTSVNINIGHAENVQILGDALLQIGEQEMATSEVRSDAPIHQYTLNGQFVRKHDTISDAGRSVNGHPSNIIKCCSGALKTAYGYVWKRVQHKD